MNNHRQKNKIIKQKITRNTYFYRKKIKHKLEKKLKNFETLDKAIKYKEKLIKRLKKLNSQEQLIKDAIEHLEDCGKPDNLNNNKRIYHCGLRVCPLCKRRYRRWIYSEALPIFKDKKALSVTLIPDIKIKKGELTPQNLNLKKLKDSLKKKIERSGLGKYVILGGVDISFEEFSDIQFWQPHFHLIVAFDKDIKELKGFKNRIRKAFKGDEFFIKRPSKITLINNEDLAKVISYLFKQIFEKNNKEFNKKGTWYLSKSEEMEIDTFLMQSSFDEFRFTRGIRKINNGLVLC